ncbi:hypothetical protein BAE44_0012062 [Dichanthelium oligosanthes]|uniref:Uncharacterized protein n=1 Tax=Dichanthelium oligosanthes TaxID=888268 RepID=A0A1E5VP50_9POAL|nr:hypothetical protein BAE44_0012062 [Dichanthelium oligosanthes]
MKRKLDSYLTSGLLEQVPDLHENLSVPESSQSDVPKDSKVSSDRNRFSSISSTRSKLKHELRELSEIVDTSVGESSDFIYAKALDANVSESIIAKPQQCARTRKKLDLVSTPVKLKEDEILTKMVTKHGLKNWQNIASAIPGRNGQQCRIRTNHALKEHWRGHMKGKLNYYLASGLLEQIPDLQEDLSVPESNQSDVPKDSQGSSERNPPTSSLPTRPKSKSDLSELDENDNTSEEESSDSIHPNGLDAHSAKISVKIMAKSKQRARARKKLDFLSTPVELKVGTAAASCQRPPLKMEQTTPAADNISPSDVCQAIPQNVPSERVDVVIPTAASNHPNDVHSWATQDPCSLEIHEANASDFLDMSYCDGLMIDFLDI